MADGWKMTSRGMPRFDRKLKKVAAAPRVISAIVTSRATSGTYKRQRGPDERESRSAGKNITIFRFHEKKGRRISFLSKSERTPADRLWEIACARFTRTGDKRYLLRAGAKVAALAVKKYRKHIEESRTARGRVRPVKPGTQKRKDREGLRPGLPPLIRTGQLIESLKPEVKVR